MATHASAEKAHRQSIQHRQRNQHFRTRLRTSLKSMRAALGTGDSAAAKASWNQTVSIIDRMVTKGVLHRNAAARHKSRLSRGLNRLSATA